MVYTCSKWLITLTDLVSVDSAGKPLIYRAVEDKKYSVIETMLEFGHGCDVSSVCQNGRQPSGFPLIMLIYMYASYVWLCVFVLLYLMDCDRIS